MQLSEMKPIVDRIVKRRCSHRIEQDVAGLTMLRLCEAMSDGFQPDNPIGFVSQVASRAIVDTLRFEFKLARDPDADVENLVDYRSPESSYETDELFREISTDEIDTKILHMRQEGKTFREIASSLAVSKSSVDRRVKTIQVNYANLSSLP